MFKQRKQAPELPLEDKIDMLRYPIIMAPLLGTLIPVMVKQLTDIEARAIGDFSLIESFHDSINEGQKQSFRKMRDYIELQHRITEAAMVKPTYQDLYAHFTKRDGLDQHKADIAKIEAELATMRPGPKRSELEEDLAGLELMVYFALPTDFTAYITAYSLGIDQTDIKKLSEDMLRTAAIMAEKGHDNPVDHIGGRFERWPGDKLFTEDINRRAVLLLAEERRLKDKHNGR
jgi:hypothetical protein